MTLTPYKISDRARQTARRSGFDIDKPDMRYPVHNPQIEQVINQRGQQIDPRTRLLLKGKDAMARFLGRERTS